MIGESPVAPSAVGNPRKGDVPRSLTKEELDKLVDFYKQAARRVIEAGFDGVEVHGAHGYLLSQFLSPLTNQRDDQFGGSIENHLRFPLQVVEAVREVVPDDRLLLYRLGVTDYMEGGLTIEEGQTVAEALAAASVDVIDVSGGLCGPRRDTDHPGYFLPLSEAVKQVVQVPVICTG